MRLLMPKSCYYRSWCFFICRSIPFFLLLLLFIVRRAHRYLSIGCMSVCWTQFLFVLCLFHFDFCFSFSHHRISFRLNHELQHFIWWQQCRQQQFYFWIQLTCSVSFLPVEPLKCFSKLKFFFYSFAFGSLTSKWGGENWFQELS